MSNLEDLALDTCRRFLTAPQLKVLCRARGFPAPAGRKEEAAAAVAARFLSPAGAREAMHSLPAQWLTVLHAVAMADKPPRLSDLVPVLESGTETWDVDFRRLMAEIAEGLLSRGVLLVRDAPEWERWSGSRYESVAFVLPGDFRPLLPPFPVPTSAPPGFGTPVREAGAAREALRIAVRRAGGRTVKGEDPVHRAAGAIALENGRLRTEGRVLADPAPLLRRVRKEWIGGGRGRRDRVAARRAATYVLSHLPDGEGVAAADLAVAVGRLGCRPKAGDLGGFLAEGTRAGLLTSGDGAEGPLYRAEEGLADDLEGVLAFSAEEGGILVDVAASGLAALLRVAAVSEVSARGDGLFLAPDPVALAREGESPVLAAVLSKSPPFAAAAEEIERRRGRTILHFGLAVLRVDEPLLLTSFTHRLADSVRPLGGPWLAVLPGGVEEVLALAKREGFAVRRVS